MSQRQLDNWLGTFLDWTLPRSEAPKSLLTWSGLFAISSVLKRRVCFPKSVLGSYTIYPNLYVIFVGPPGAVRKSTTAGYTETLLRGLTRPPLKPDGTPPPLVHLGPTSGSDAKLIELMSEIPDGSISVISSEFGTFMKATPESMYDTLTHLFDCPSEYSHSTRMHGEEIVDEPCLNLLGCTTPSWIAENPTYMIGGGFSSRTIFVYETVARQRVMYYGDLWADLGLTAGDFEEMETALRHDLEIMAQAEGEFSIESRELRNEIEAWYISHANSAHEFDDAAAGFFNRKHVHLHKLMMILSIAESNDLVVKKHHFREALEILNVIDSKVSKALSSVGKNPYSSTLHELEEYISAHEGWVEKKVILQHFWNQMEEEELNKLLGTLVTLEMVKVDRKGRNPKYKGLSF